MCENLQYESVYFKELHNEQEYYLPTIYRAGAAVVSTITSSKYNLRGVKKLIVPKVATTTFGHLFPLGTLCQMKQEALLIFNTSKLCVKQTTFKK